MHIKGNHSHIRGFKCTEDSSQLTDLLGLESVNFEKNYVNLLIRRDDFHCHFNKLFTSENSVPQFREFTFPESSNLTFVVVSGLSGLVCKKNIL